MIHSDEEEADLVLHVILLLCLIKQHNDSRGIRNNITRSALVPSNLSPWRHLLHNADEASFLNYTGLSRVAFKELHKALFTEEELVIERDARLAWRPKDLTTKDEVGLYLFYVNSRMRQKDLALIFGIIPSSVSRYITSMRKRVIEKLLHNEHAEIRFPNNRRTSG